MNPLELKGPEFLSLFVGLFVAAAFLAAFVRKLIRPPYDAPKCNPSKFKPYMVAYLAGGSRGALAAAMANLIQTGVLKVDASDGTLSQSTELPDDSPSTRL